MKKRKTICDLFSIAPEQHKARLELKEAKRLASIDPNAPRFIWFQNGNKIERRELNSGDLFKEFKKPQDPINCRCSPTFIESTYENNVSKK